MQLLQQAIGLHGQGVIAEAERLYRLFLDQEPKQPDALALLGVLLSGKGKHNEALQNLEQAVQCDPEAPLFRYYLGNLFATTGDCSKAVASYREALNLKPDYAEAHYGLGLVLHKMNESAAALDALRQTVKLKSNHTNAWLALSNIALQTADYQLALCAAKQATLLQPDNLAAPVAEALALDYLDREEDAIFLLKRVIDIKPTFIEAWDMLGMTLQKLNRLDEAEVVFRQTIIRAGCALADENDLNTDEENYSIYHWNLALLELLRGDLRNGFAHYRARFKISGKQQRLRCPKPIWRGEDISGKTLLVVGEQGFGDVLMLCRYGTLLKAKGARVIFLVHPALISLLREANLADAITSETPQGQETFDFQTSIFDLPYVSGTTLESIPNATPYLPTPTPDEATKIADSLTFKAGIVWAGRNDFGNNRRRSLKLEIFSTLFHDNADIKFYSLMRDVKPEDTEILAQHAVVDLSSKLTDFHATAQFIGQLDLVITCDTAVAHLAGGMGKEVWLLLPFAPDWRWLMGRDDSPWYPTMRLFRQHQKTDWPEVIERVRDELELRLNASQK